MHPSVRQVVLFGLKPSLNLDFARTGALDSRITFTRASTGWDRDVSGNWVPFLTNIPRFGYDSGHGALGLAIEEARTQLLLNSLLDGTSLSTQDVTVAAVPHALTFENAGTLTLSGVSTAGPLVGTGATDRVVLLFTPTAGVLHVTVTGSVKFAQLEATTTFNTGPTTFIPSAGATVTRAAEIPTISGASFSGFYNQAAGTWLLDVVPSGDYNQLAVIVEAGSDSSNLMAMTKANAAINAAGKRWGALANSAGAVQTFAAGADGAATRTRLAIAYAANDIRVVQGGTLIGTSTSFTPPAMTSLSIGLRTLGGNNFWLNGHAAGVKYWNKALTTAQMQALTA